MSLSWYHLRLLDAQRIYTLPKCGIQLSLIYLKVQFMNARISYTERQERKYKSTNHQTQTRGSVIEVLLSCPSLVPEQDGTFCVCWYPFPSGLGLMVGFCSNEPSAMMSSLGTGKSSWPMRWFRVQRSWPCYWGSSLLSVDRSRARRDVLCMLISISLWFGSDGWSIYEC
jgi:hypothetical protein